MSTKFTLEIITDNAAFNGEREAWPQMRSIETARILRKAADQVEAGELDSRAAHDSNGNLVGGWAFT